METHCKNRSQGLVFSGTTSVELQMGSARASKACTLISKPCLLQPSSVLCPTLTLGVTASSYHSQPASQPWLQASPTTPLSASVSPGPALDEPIGCLSLHIPQVPQLD